ncbi:MAG: DNA cytosine methyltransferase [Methylobacter sp.]
MTAYYNEIDPKAAAWLRELIKQGLIADGIVDERSITEVAPNELAGFAQCHFFAGIGGWSYALRLAGIPDEYPVWTGSCPCQPFSAAGSNKGKSDERHLWPAFFNLIKQCGPITVFGEQVEGAVKHGWLDDLSADLERENYAVGAAVLGAHSIKGWHERNRIYWVAHNTSSESFNCVQYFRSQTRSSEDTSSIAVDFVDFDFGMGIGKKRIPKPSCGWVVDDVPARVVRLRGYGNAIVPQVAAEFIGAFFDVVGEYE